MVNQKCSLETTVLTVTFCINCFIVCIVCFLLDFSVCLYLFYLDVVSPLYPSPPYPTSYFYRRMTSPLVWVECSTGGTLTTPATARPRSPCSTPRLAAARRLCASTVLKPRTRASTLPARLHLVRTRTARPR